MLVGIIPCSMVEVIGVMDFVSYVVRDLMVVGQYYVWLGGVSGVVRAVAAYGWAVDYDVDV